MIKPYDEKNLKKKKKDLGCVLWETKPTPSLKECQRNGGMQAGSVPFLYLRRGNPSKLAFDNI